MFYQVKTVIKDKFSIAKIYKPNANINTEKKFYHNN